MFLYIVTSQHFNPHTKSLFVLHNYFRNFSCTGLSIKEEVGSMLR
jgi:hypothetical protein